MKRLLIGLFAVVLIAAGCGSSKSASQPHTTAPPATKTSTNVYANDGANHFVAATKNVPYRLYVPNSDEHSMMVVDPNTQKVIDTIDVGENPQHVVPSWDLKTLYVTNDKSNSLTPIDPMTSKRAGPDIPVDDPYNMYFTPDGKSAIVVAEARQNLDFRDPHTFALQKRVHVNCAGVDHVDFAADNSYFLATCEFSGKLVKVNLKDDSVAGYLTLDKNAMPQDIKLDPQGQLFYVADMANNGLWEVDAKTFTKVGFLATGPEAHGLYPSRDAKYLYVSNRGGMGKNGDKGSISVIDFATRQIVANWPIAPPSTPDMGGVSADGSVLWLSGRRNGEIYGIDTKDGHLVARIKVGKGPHGLCVWPQPGTYSLGHTGILR
jgi:YVTN family beta-propeller protein